MEAEGSRHLMRCREYRKLHRFAIFFRKFNRVRLEDKPYLQHLECEKQCKSSRGAKSCFQNNGKRLLPVTNTFHHLAIEFGFWSDAFLACWALCHVHFFSYLYHQYKLDWNLIRLDYLTFRRDSPGREIFGIPMISPITDELLEGLGATIEHEHRWLDLLGQPMRHLTFFAESFFLTQSFFTILSFIMPQLYFTFVHIYDQYILRILLDYDRELSLCKLLVREQVEEFLISHRNSSNVMVLTGFDYLDKLRQVRDIEKAQVLTGQDGFLERELLAMEARGKLLPANRSIEWIHSWLRSHLLMVTLPCVSNLVITLSCVLILYFLPLLRPDDEPLHWLRFTLADWAVILETIIMQFAIACSLNFYATIVTFSVVDQLWLAKDMKIRYERFWIKSKVKLSTLSATQLHEWAELRRDLNSNLLELLMQFRIFSKQFGTQRNVYTCILLGLVGLFFMVPVLMRVHTPYIDPNMDSLWAVMVIAIFFALSIVSVGLLVPCWMFSHCVKLHRVQQKLIAHIVQVEQLYPSFYNSHLIRRLRSEAGCYERLAEDFAFSFLGFRLTYESMMKLYFWYGATMFTSFVRPSMITAGLDARTGKPRRQYTLMVASLLDDPLGILV